MARLLDNAAYLRQGFRDLGLKVIEPGTLPDGSEATEEVPQDCQNLRDRRQPAWRLAEAEHRREQRGTGPRQHAEYRAALPDVLAVSRADKAVIRRI